MKKFKFDEIIEIDGFKLNKKNLAPLTKEERIDLIEPIFKYLRFQGFIYPDDTDKIHKEWKRLLDYQPDLSQDYLYNNCSRATYICKFFCKDFYNTIDKIGQKTMIEIFNDDDLLKKVIQNRLGIDWYGKYKPMEGVFNLTPKMFLQGFRSTRLIVMTSIFKPSIAKHITMKYSEKGDTIYDPSAGWGGRMLGTISCDRKYVGVDPLTIPDLEKMKNFLNLKDCYLYKDISENFKYIKNSIDLCYTSPPYYNQEIFSTNESQAYMKGEDYFYNIYWKKTLENIKYMLKPDKIFALNVKNFPKMVDMAEKLFTLDHTIGLSTYRSHLNKTSSDNAKKIENVYILKNNK